MGKLYLYLNYIQENGSASFTAHALFLFMPSVPRFQVCFGRLQLMTLSRPGIFYYRFIDLRLFISQLQTLIFTLSKKLIIL